MTPVFVPKPVCLDLSHHNTVYSLVPASETGIVGVIHKLTEGESYIDDKVQARHALAREAGLLWGIYHFLRPGNLVDQAVFFTEVAEELNVLGPDTLICADHEDPDVSLEDLQLFLDTVEGIVQRSCVIYSGHVLKEQLLASPEYAFLADHRLWLCHYTSGGTEPTLPEFFDRYWLWQYTDKGEWPGIEPPTDLNAIWPDMPLERFMAEWSGHEAPTYSRPPERLHVTTLTITSTAPISIVVDEERVLAPDNGNGRK